jgi:hypothetical protein
MAAVGRNKVVSTVNFPRRRGRERESRNGDEMHVHHGVNLIGIIGSLFGFRGRGVLVDRTAGMIVAGVA